MWFPGPGSVVTTGLAGAGGVGGRRRRRLSSRRCLTPRLGLLDQQQVLLAALVVLERAQQDGVRIGLPCRIAGQLLPLLVGHRAVPSQALEVLPDRGVVHVIPGAHLERTAQPQQLLRLSIATARRR